MPSLAEAFAALDRRLDPRADAPLAIGVSGGGDSLALLQLAADWARAHGRRLIVLHVDHQLQSQSSQWAQHAQAAAEAAGARFALLTWTGEKPKTGLSAAARSARHRLLAQAARRAGARVLLLGHTLDDLDEARLMRQAGSNVGSPREWSPSPVWPEGRDVFLLRPLLAVRRQVLRDFLTGRGVAWIDDPANQDLRSARARARIALSQATWQAQSEPLADGFKGWDGSAWSEAHGALTISRAAARAAPAAELAAACLCAAGGERPPRAGQVAALATRLADQPEFVSTLAGARIQATPESVIFSREPGESARNRPGLAQVRAGETMVWDGRFELTADEDLTLQPLSGLMARLARRDRMALASLPPAVRRGLPAAVNGRNQVACLTVSGAPTTARSLAWSRLAAFCGAYQSEAALPFAGQDRPSHSEKACG